MNENNKTTKQRIGVNGRVIQGTSAKGKEYTAYEIYYVKSNGQELSIKQVFLSDLELEMLAILQSKEA